MTPSHALLLALRDLPWLLWLAAVIALWPCWRRLCRRAVCRLLGGHVPVFLGLADSPRGVEIWHACQRCDWCGVDHLDEWRGDETTPLPSEEMECER